MYFFRNSSDKYVYGSVPFKKYLKVGLGGGAVCNIEAMKSGTDGGQGEGPNR